MQSEKLSSDVEKSDVNLNYRDAGKMVNLAEEINELNSVTEKLTEYGRRLREKAKTLEKKERREYGIIRSAKSSVRDKKAISDSFNNRKVAAEYKNREEAEPTSYEEISTERDRLLEKNADEYYKIGAMTFFAKGNLSVIPNKFIKDGFNIKEGDSFSDKLEQLEDREAESEFTISTAEKTADIADGMDRDKIDSLERDVILGAIKRGCFIKANAYTEESVEFSLPTDQSGLVNFMRNYDVEPKSDEVRRLSYSGFSNIIKDMANVATDPESTEEERVKNNERGISQLNWYFDNFDYYDGAEHSFYEFLNHMNNQYEVMGDDWKSIYESFLNQRKEYLDLFPQTEQEKETKADKEKKRIASAELVDGDWEEELNKILKELEDELDLDDTDQEILREIESGEYNPGSTTGKNTRNLAKSEIVYFIRRRVSYFRKEMKRIKKIDPKADLYIERFSTGKVDKEGNPIKNQHQFPYLVIRFGNVELGTNNIYAESTEPINAAFYAWKGGDSGESWRNIFAGSKPEARARDDIQPFNHNNQYNVENPLDGMYKRIHEFAPYPHCFDSMTVDMVEEELLRKEQQRNEIDSYNKNEEVEDKKAIG